MIEWAHGDPVPWRDALDEREPFTARAIVARLGALTGGDAKFPAKSVRLTSDAIASCLVKYGAAETGAIVEPHLPVIARAVDEDRVLFASDPAGDGLGLVTLRCVFECGGLTMPDALANAPVDEWLRLLVVNAKLMFPDDRIGIALACLATGRGAAVPGLLGKKKLATRFRRNEVFYDDLRGFVAYLARAVELDRPSEDVEHAWNSMVWSFPTLRKEYAWSWSDLLWAARVRYHVIEERPLAEVGPALHAYVRTL
jgi:hypothetical protein